MRLVKHPILCNYYLTYRCNARCGFCDIWQRPSPYATAEAVAQNLKDLKKLGVKVIDFTGGEPLLHRELPAFCALAKEMGFLTTLTSNGILYPKRAKSLQGKVDMLHFSLDAADATTHDAIRGVKCFAAVRKSLEIALELGERPDILFTVLNENLGEIEKIWRNFALKYNLVLILNPVFSYGTVAADGKLTPHTLSELEKWGKKKNIYLNQAFIDLRRRGGNRIKKTVCKAASTTLVISPKNELVLPCYHLGIAHFPIAQNLYALYRSDEIQKLVAKEGRYAACEGCTINCYMQPSFAVSLNRYGWAALGSTLKYNRMKGTWKKLLPLRN